jgi:hypothetical protein
MPAGRYFCDHLGPPVLGADVIVDAEIVPPTTGAFNVIMMGIIEPPAKAILVRLLGGRDNRGYKKI